MIVEIGIEITVGQLRRIEGALKAQNIPYYVEPPREPPFETLEELKEDCDA